MFEDLSTLPHKWETLFAFIFDNHLHMTRLDIAFDDHTGILDIERIAQDTQEQHFVSRMKCWEVVRSSAGTSCQIGSPKSKVVKFDGIHCPNCGMMVKRGAGFYSCRCGWRYVEPESNLWKRFLYGPRY